MPDINWTMIDAELNNWVRLQRAQGREPSWDECQNLKSELIRQFNDGTHPSQMCRSNQLSASSSSLNSEASGPVVVLAIIVLVLWHWFK